MLFIHLQSLHSWQLPNFMCKTMGCTSSAPNMVSSSTAEKSIKFEEETSDASSKDTEEIIYRARRDSNEITVLPSCDNLAETLHVVRNSSTPSLKTKKDNDDDRQPNENIKMNDSSNTLNEDVSKLGNVVEKLFQLHNLEDVEDKQPVAKVVQEPPKINDDSDMETRKDGHNSEEHQSVEDKEIVEHLEEAASPSQSESSRATRWEALADIAAELPPSLTVDPITGQIYAVTK